MERIWGINLGTTSVGFAVINYDQARESGMIVRTGVRIFPEGVVPTGGGKSREPPNKTRRAKRLMRRQTRRKKYRRRLLGDILANDGLLPKFGTPEWRRLLAEPPPAKQRQGARPIDPYELRALALRERLEPWEIGRAIYHLAKRRGFAGRRIKENNDPQKAKEEETEKESQRFSPQRSAIKL